MTDIERFELGVLSIRVFASSETFAALYDDVVALLETKYEPSAWEVVSEEDVTDNAEHRDALDRLRQEAEVASRFR
ncbi:hypothetical protein [Microbacterium jiangjiandongii]|uniref:hypothetical protein n=1 Tax=Microbacterium jiangjiandongii TaxID=3049071 RepID=UPI00214B16A3|nr:hypothetical protein [Microbacterium sp. zg.Y843]MCR2814706.1 hypothetical protein [Microbacterium sp. zg.Y843]